VSNFDGSTVRQAWSATFWNEIVRHITCVIGTLVRTRVLLSLIATQRENLISEIHLKDLLDGLEVFKVFWD
jgi:hypothetical protein